MNSSNYNSVPSSNATPFSARTSAPSRSSTRSCSNSPEPVFHKATVASSSNDPFSPRRLLDAPPCNIVSTTPSKNPSSLGGHDWSAMGKGSSSLKSKFKSSASSNSSSQMTDSSNSDSETLSSTSSSKASALSSSATGAASATGVLAGSGAGGKRSNQGSPNPYVTGSGGGSHSVGPSSPQPSSVNITTQVPISERQQLALLMKQYGNSSPSSLTCVSGSEHDISISGPYSAVSPATVSSTSTTPQGNVTPNRRAGLYKRNQMGETSLHLAAKRGDLEKVKRLIEQGLDVNITDNAGWTPLHEACVKDHVDVAACLLDNGADVHVQGGDDCDTPLHDTAAGRLYDATLLLLKRGADPYKSNKLGDTAVSLAQEDAEMTALLLAGTSQWQSLAFKKPPIDGAGSNSSSSVAADTAAAEHVKSSQVQQTSSLFDDKQTANSPKSGEENATGADGNSQRSNPEQKSTAAEHSRKLNKKTSSSTSSSSSSSDNTPQLESKDKSTTVQEKVSQITSAKDDNSSGSCNVAEETQNISMSVNSRTLGMSSKKSPISGTTSSVGSSSAATSALSSASSNNADISSDDEFQDSPGELFIDEGLEETPRKASSTTSNISNSSSATQMISSNLNLNKNRKSPVSSDHAKTDIASKFEGSGFHGRSIGIQQSSGLVSGSFDKKSSPAHSTGDRSPYSRQSSIMSEKSSTSEQLSSQSAIEEETKLGGAHFPNIITSDGELLKKRKKRDKNKVKTSSKDQREKEPSSLQQPPESKSNPNVIKEKMHKKKRKHDSRSNSEEPPSLPANSNVHSSPSVKRQENPPENSNEKSNLSSDSSNVSQKNVSFKKTLPLKPLKVETKLMKCSSVKSKNDDDKLFKPDPVIKSPKLSPKSLEKSKFRVNPSSSGHPQTQLSERTNVSSVFAVSASHQNVKATSERPQIVENTRDAAVKESVEAPKFGDTTEVEDDLNSYANKKKRLAEFQMHQTQPATSVPQNSPSSSGVQTASDIMPTPKISEPLSSHSIPPSHATMFHNSPVVRLTVEPTIEARTAEQSSSQLIIQPTFERGTEVRNETTPQRLPVDSTAKYDDNLKDPKKWQMQNASRETSTVYKSAGDEIQSMRNPDRNPQHDPHDKQKSEQREKLPKILIGDKLSRSLNDSFSLDEEGDSFEDNDALSNDEFDEEIAESASQSEMESKATGGVHQEGSSFAPQQQQQQTSLTDEKAPAATSSSKQLIKTEANIKIEGTFGISAEKFIPVTKPTPNYQQIKTCEKVKIEKGEIMGIVIVKSDMEIKEEVEEKITKNHSDGTLEEPINAKTMSSSSSGGVSNATPCSKEQQQQEVSCGGEDNTIKAEVCDDNVTDIVTSMDKVVDSAGLGNNGSNQMDVDVTFLQENANIDDNDANLEDAAAGSNATGGSSAAAGDNASLRGGLGRRRKRPLKFSDGNDSPIDYVLMNERGRPPKRGGASNQRKETSSDNGSSVDTSNAKQTRRKGRWANTNTDSTSVHDGTTATSRRAAAGGGEEPQEYIGKTRTATRNSAKNAAYNSTSKPERKTERTTINSTQQSQTQSANVDQPPIILKINTSQFRTSSPTMGSQAENEGSTEADPGVERSATPMRNENSQDSNASDKTATPDTASSKSKTERTPRITRTLRSNAHLKRELGALNDSQFLQNEDSNSSSCSNESAGRKASSSASSSRNSSTGLVTSQNQNDVKEEPNQSQSTTSANVGGSTSNSRAHTPTFSQTSGGVETSESTANAKQTDSSKSSVTEDVKSSNHGATVKSENVVKQESETSTSQIAATTAASAPTILPSTTSSATSSASSQPVQNSTVSSSSSAPTGANTSSSTANSEPSQQHPKRRKLAKHKAEAEAKSNAILDVPPIAPPDEKFTNSIYTYMQMRRSIRQKQLASLPQVPPKVQPFYEDYYCIKKHYLIEGHKNNYPKLKAVSEHLENYPVLKQVFEKQEKDRNKLKVQQLIERERLQLVCESETLRIYTRSALAEKNQTANLSVCQILAEEELYNVNVEPNASSQQLTDLSRACSSRGRHNLRQFQNWLTDNNEKLERMKSNMLKRHTHESHALRAAQALEWSFKLRHIQPPLPAAVAEELSEANFVPRVDLVKEVMVPF